MKKLITILGIIATLTIGLIGCDTKQVQHEAFTQIETQAVEQTETKSVDDTFEYGKLVADTQYQKSQKGVEKVMLVKMISENEIEELNPDYIIVDGVVYTNPRNNPNIDLKALGYKNFFVDDVPEFDGETQKAERYYYDNGDTIHRGWKIYNLTKEELEEREKMRDLMKGEA